MASLEVHLVILIEDGLVMDFDALHVFASGIFDSIGAEVP